LLKGSVEVSSKIGHGTGIEVVIPYESVDGKIVVTTIDDNGSTSGTETEK